MSTTIPTDALNTKTILASIQAAGYKTFTSETPYDLNVWGVRSNNPVANTFNDYLGITYRDQNNVWHTESWVATTDPGTYWLEGYDSSRVKGTAILVPGQYRSTYKVDLHGGKYEALCQRAGPVKVWRDSNRDDVLDWGEGPEYEGYYGINLHHASYTGTSTQVNKWSAGCQVIANIDDFNRFMTIVKRQTQFHPTWDKYTYTLLTQDQLVTT